jgi:hypothetical protein
MTPAFHPATLQLLRLQSRGRRRRMWLRFCQPRRVVLSAIACLLAVAWLGNAAMTIWLRETGSPATLRGLLSLGLALYVGWHLTKAAFFRPEGPFDWTPAERELLAAMPLRSRDLVAYQLASVTVTTLLKTGLFALLLLPDLRCVPLGMTGLVLAMMTLEVVRMAVEIAIWGMSRSAYLLYRAAVVAGLLAAGITMGTVVLREDMLLRGINAGEGPFHGLLNVLLELDTSAFRCVALPFRPLVDLILAESITASNLGLAAAGMATLMALSVSAIGLHALASRQVASREKRAYRLRSGGDGSIQQSPLAQHDRQGASSPPPLRRIPRLGGAGPLVWRQLRGARRYWGSLLTAMIAPAVLACAPCFVIADPYVAFLSTTGALAFYTFLLLPTALRFDFRRDLDRLALLKGLPIRPAAAAIGQTLAPVLLATAFQTGILTFAAAARSLPPYYAAVAMLVMVPLNVLVFGLDNLIYLLYPHRLQQEGLEIFLRTMLTFTGKGLLFAVGLVAMSAWGFAAAALTRGLASWTLGAVNAYAVFTGGMIAGLSLLAAGVVCGLARAYRAMDGIEDGLR